MIQSSGIEGFAPFLATLGRRARIMPSMLFPKDSSTAKNEENRHPACAAPRSLELTAVMKN